MTGETHMIEWRGIAITITYTAKRWSVVDHIEIESEARVPLPITETGYRSHFLTADEVEYVDERGGAAVFVREWLDLMAEQTGWRGAQLSLF